MGCPRPSPGYDRAAGAACQPGLGRQGLRHALHYGNHVSVPAPYQDARLCAVSGPLNHLQPGPMMRLQIFENKISLAQAAAQQAAAAIRRALAERGQARIVAATGVSQFDFLEALTTAPGIN